MRYIKLAVIVTLLQALILGPVLYWGPSLAGVVARSTKAGSTTSFATSFSLGNTLAVADLDTDLNNVYSEFNGNIESANIKDATIAAADLATSSVTSAKILDDTIATADLGDLQVTRGKLAVGATTGASAISNITPALDVTSTETNLLLLSSITTHGGLVIGAASGSVRYTANVGVASTITLRVYRDASVIKTEIRTVNGVNVGPDPIPLPLPVFAESPTAAAHVYKITVQTNSVNVHVLTDAVEPGGGWVVELT